MEVPEGPNTKLSALPEMVASVANRLASQKDKRSHPLKVQLSTLRFDLPSASDLSDTATLAALGMNDEAQKNLRLFCTVYNDDASDPLLCFRKEKPTPAAVSSLLSLLQVAHHKLHAHKESTIAKWSNMYNFPPGLRALSRFFDAATFKEVTAPDVALIAAMMFATGRFLLDYDFAVGVGQEQSVLRYSREIFAFLLATPTVQTPAEDGGGGGARLKPFPAATAITTVDLREDAELAAFFKLSTIASIKSLYTSALPVGSASVQLLELRSSEATEHMAAFQEQVAESEDLTKTLENLLPGRTAVSSAVSSSSSALPTEWLRIIPSKTLRDSNSRVPCLCYNENKQLVVFTGIPGCSNGIVQIYEPLKGKHREVAPDSLARALASRLGALASESFKLVESRPPSELLVVAFDRSNSMSGRAFPRNPSGSAAAAEEANVYTTPSVPVSGPDAFDAMVQFRNDSIWFPVLRNTLLQRRRAASKVFEAMALLALPHDHFTRCMVAQHGELCIALLKAAPGPRQSLPPNLQTLGTRTPPSSSDPTFQIMCRERRTITVDVQGSWTIRAVKYEVESKIGIPASHIRLQYQGRRLPNHKTLTECGVKKHASLTVGINPEASPRGYRRSGTSPSSAAGGDTAPVMTFDFGRGQVIRCSGAETCEQLAARYCEKEGTLPHNFSLWAEFKDTGDGHRQGTLIFDLRSRYRFQKLSRRFGEGKIKVDVEVCSPRKDPNLKHRRMSRLVCSKQLFENFINRAQAYNFPTKTGLVVFGSEVEKTCQLTGLIESFRDKINAIETAGGTALNKAISVSITMLREAMADIEKKNASTQEAFDCAMQEYEDTMKAYRNQESAEGAAAAPTGADAVIPMPTLPAAIELQPRPKLRILVLSDGVDEDSPASMTPESLLSDLLEHSITLDAIVLGSGSSSSFGGRDPMLKLLSLASGGYVFAPMNVEEAIKITEHETMVSGCDRPSPAASRDLEVARVLNSSGSRNSAMRRFLDKQRNKTFHYSDSGVVLSRKRPDEMVRAAATLEAALAKMESGSGDAQMSGKIVKRLMMEMKKIKVAALPHVDIFPSTKNIRFWKVVIEAPRTQGVAPEADRDCLYAGANFALYIQFPIDFPDRPPSIRFVTPICHVNVNSHGRICHGILGRDWNPRTSVKQVVDCIYGLLLHPDIDDALDSRLAFLARQRPNTAYVDMVKAAARDPRCLKSRDEWRSSMLSGEDPDVIDLSSSAAASF
jgi:ubiquitin-protein ligase